MLPALENGLPTGFVDCETGNECSDCQRLRELVHAFTSIRLPLVQLPVIFFYLKKNMDSLEETTIDASMIEQSKIDNHMCFH